MCKYRLRKTAILSRGRWVNLVLQAGFSRPEQMIGGGYTVVSPPAAAADDDNHDDYIGYFTLKFPNIKNVIHVMVTFIFIISLNWHICFFSAWLWILQIISILVSFSFSGHTENYLTIICVLGEIRASTWPIGHNQLSITYQCEDRCYILMENLKKPHQCGEWII